MKKDIFIDNNIAKNFTNPLDPEYKKLIKWLLTYNETAPDPANDAFLVLSHKLLKEYNGSAQNTNKGTSIPVIIDVLTRQGRRVFITNDKIKEFRRIYFTKKVLKNLGCNEKDRNHIPIVLLSHRKYALAIDDNFVYDLNNFPGFQARAEKRPENLPYI